MREQIKVLSQLQDIDMHIRRLGERRAKIPSIIEEMRSDFVRQEEEARKIKTELEGVQKERRHQEGELEAGLEVLRKYRSQLIQVKTNKEYVAFLDEISDVEEKNGELEEEILILMEKGDDLTRSMQERGEELKAKKGRMEQEISEREKENKSLEQELTEEGKKRAELASRIEASLLRRYEKVRDGKGGLALVEVKDDCCGGCHMQLPPQTISELMRQDRIVNCETCSRLLYWESE